MNQSIQQTANLLQNPPMVQDRKGTPFEIFLRLLSTNEKPAFKALDQSEPWISNRLSVLTKSGKHQCTANVPINIQLEKKMLIDYQWNNNPMSME